jgi:hypothetical protein
MRIKAVKMYLKYENEVTARAMNRAHFGVMYWITPRLKRAYGELGAGLNDVDVINIYFCENASLCEPKETWSHLLNALEYKLIFDVISLTKENPVDNAIKLLSVSASVLFLAPWPQVRAIGRVLQEPISAADYSALKTALKRWEAIVDKAAAGHGHGHTHVH